MAISAPTRTHSSNNGGKMIFVTCESCPKETEMQRKQGYSVQNDRKTNTLLNELWRRCSDLSTCGASRDTSNSEYFEVSTVKHYLTKQFFFCSRLYKYLISIMVPNFATHYIGLTSK